MMSPYARALDVTIGTIILIDGEAYKVEGWFRDGNGRVNLLYGDRWHRHFANERITLAFTGWTDR